MTRKIILATIIVLLIGISASLIRIQEVRAAVTVNVTLYGSASGGWGLTAASITSPGPTITVNQYDVLNLTLYSQDGLPHRFFVDYNNNSIVDAGENASNTFSTSTVFVFNATVSGNFTYRCSVHSASMYGKLEVAKAVPEFSPLLILPLFIAVTMVAAIAHKTKQSAKKIQDTSMIGQDSQHQPRFKKQPALTDRPKKTH
jgi:plastocyanin